ncbi:cytochrome P450 [Jimgerdemannia flammicorona]|uniref:Cytochrome P450 n=1 Tax=Jimgerdemannia flammicorona TaxID=994334 RepID=A0A433DAT0_9FUNG|nr:cytochrome P450 [Jimgerdemannia flammicorona]
MLNLLDSLTFVLSSPSLLLFLFLFLFLLVALPLLFLTRSSFSTPGPRPLPFLGNLIEVAGAFNDFADWTYRTTLKYSGRSWTYAAPFIGRFVVATDPRVMEFVLGKEGFDNFEKGLEFRWKIAPLFGTGIFNSDGPHWVHQRKIISRIFTSRNLREYFTRVFLSHSAILGAVLSTLAASDDPIDLQDLFHRLTLDSFSQIAFSCRLESLQGAAACSDASWGHSFSESQRIVSRRLFDPLWWFKEKTGKDNVELKKHLEVVDALVYRIIEERRGEVGDGEEVQGEDLLSRFMRYRDEDTGEALSNTELRDWVVNMTIAGRDTTATGLSWAIYRLAQNPTVLSKLRAELATHLPHDRTTEITHEMLADLVYTHACYLESLRLHPSIPANMKMCVRDTFLPDGTPVHKGNWLLWSTYAMGRMESIWGPDAMEYKPERWLVESVDKLGKKCMSIKQESPFKFLAFNAGPRSCLGMTMAILEAKTTLALLLRDFDIELLNDPPVEYTPSITYYMKNGLWVKVHKRKADEAGDWKQDMVGSVEE